MKIVYRILSDNVKFYTNNIVACDAICAGIIENGFIPKVRRMLKRDVPISDLKLVEGL